MTPGFRNDAEAQRHAALHRPFENAFGALGEDYAPRYGARAAAAAANCRSAARCGDARALQVHQHALSLLLFADQPQLFESRKRASSPRASAHSGGDGRSSACDAQARKGV